MEKKPTYPTFPVLIKLKSDSEKVNLRNRTSFSPEESEQLHIIFGKDWLNAHPVIIEGTNLSMDLSMFDLVNEDLQYFAHIYNNPLSLQEILTSECPNIFHLRRFQKVTKLLNLACTNPILNHIEDQLFEKKRILILVDLNGTLMYKSEKDLGAARPFDLKWKMNHFYLRPGYNLLLQKILSHPRSVVAICSSMVQKNIVPLRGLLIRDPEVKKVEGKFLKKIFDRAYTAKDSTEEDKFATVKDLGKVWSDKELKGKFGPQNTLLIESDEKKARNFKANAFMVLPYVEQFVASLIPNNTYYMNAVADYVIELLNKADDVPDYLMKNAFEMDEKKLCEEDLEFKKILENQKLRLEKEAAKKTEEVKAVVDQHKAELEAKKAVENKEKKNPENKMSDLEENIKKMEDADI